MKDGIRGKKRKYQLAVSGLILSISFSLITGCGDGGKKDSKTTQSQSTEAQIQETAKTQTEQSTETQTDVQSTTVASDAVTIVDDGNGIGVEEAKEIALQNAGLESSEVVFTKEKQDRDGRSVEYLSLIHI